MLVDYSCSEDGNRHRLVIVYNSGREYIHDYEGSFQQFFDDNAVWFTLPEKNYCPEDLRGKSGKFSRFASLRLQ